MMEVSTDYCSNLENTVEADENNESDLIIIEPHVSNAKANGVKTFKETAALKKNVDSDSNIENDDSNEILGVALDPSTTQDYESVETITVDANQKTQDEDDSEVSNDHSALHDCTSGLGTTVKEKVNNHQDSIQSDTTADDSISMVEVINDAPSCSENSTSERLTGYKYLKQFKLFSNLTDEWEKKSNSSQEKDPLEKLGESLNLVSYVCEGCDSKFWIERFYTQHKSRVTTQILYDCKQCKKGMVFSNPCSLKIHLMGHGNQINLGHLQESNLKISVPELCDFKEKFFSEFNFQKSTFPSHSNVIEINDEKMYKCPECCEFVPSLIMHLMYKANSVKSFSCKLCHFIFSSRCSFEMHLRFHRSKKPYSCPECGSSFVTRNRLKYHLALECFHFSRYTIFKCQCGAFEGSRTSLRAHVQLKHFKNLYRCSICKFYFGEEEALAYHCKAVHSEWYGVKPNNLYFRCDLCSGDQKLHPYCIQEQHVKSHLRDKVCRVFGFRCMCCKRLFYNPVDFMDHMEQSKCMHHMHGEFVKLNPSVPIPFRKRKCPEYENVEIRKMMKTYFSDNKEIKSTGTEIVRVKTLNISKQPILKHSPSKFSMTSSTHMICPLCDKYFLQREIKSHILSYHKCQDTEKYIQLSREVVPVQNDVMKKSVQSKQEPKSKGMNCPSCQYVAASKEDFQSHIVEHREDGAYQCLECGECFVCRNPLEIHLVSVHSIKDTAHYISTHFVHNSLPKPEKRVLQPNQCSVCFDIFPDEKTLRLHFRSHGMAFLRQNFANRISSK